VIPNLHRTWAPRGQTPLHRHSYRHDRVSVISAISVSPLRHQLGLYYQLHFHNIRQPQVCDFVRQLLRHLRGRVIIVWDRATFHKGDLIRELCRQFPRLWLERFPAYAPELNPDEGIWRNTKHRLANGNPAGSKELAGDVVKALRRLRRRPELLRACITASDLPSFLP
jgi:transposase